jgi:hypothetical protein
MKNNYSSAFGNGVGMKNNYSSDIEFRNEQLLTITYRCSEK